MVIFLFGHTDFMPIKTFGHYIIYIPPFLFYLYLGTQIIRKIIDNIFDRFYQKEG